MRPDCRMLKNGWGWPGRPPARGTEERMGLIIFCARATRGLRRPSLDARSRRPIRPILEEPTSELGRIIYVVRRAHSRSDQATLESKIGDWKAVCSWGHPSHPLVSDSSLRLCLRNGAPRRAWSRARPQTIRNRRRTLWSARCDE